jgi:hypothetical protein
LKSGAIELGVAGALDLIHARRDVSDIRRSMRLPGNRMTSFGLNFERLIGLGLGALLIASCATGTALDELGPDVLAGGSGNVPGNGGTGNTATGGVAGGVIAGSGGASATGGSSAAGGTGASTGLGGSGAVSGTGGVAGTGGAVTGGTGGGLTGGTGGGGTGGGTGGAVTGGASGTGGVAGTGGGTGGSAGTGGGGGTGGATGTGPCAGLCASPTVITMQQYTSGNLGAGAACHETTFSIQGGNCSNFAGRTLTVNGTEMMCDGSWGTLPAKVAGGYCIQSSAGGLTYASFVTY